MQLSEIRLDKALRELTIQGEPGWPIAIYDNDMDGFLGGSVPWHWHREVELNYVCEGRMVMEAGSQSSVLEGGQGIFVNSGVLHRMERENIACRMVTLVFDPLLISGAETSILHSRYILPLTQSSSLPAIWLNGGLPWHREAVSRMERVFALDQAGGFGCEAAIRQTLTELWLELLRENKAQLGRETPEPEDHRLKKMLQYLQAHLAEPVRLEDVAASAGVSSRECTRCFRAALGTTPMVYLTELRVRAAAALLERTDDPVTDVGFAVGFASPSYFGSVFRRYTGFSPRSYRKHARASDVT